MTRKSSLARGAAAVAAFLSITVLAVPSALASPAATLQGCQSATDPTSCSNPSPITPPSRDVSTPWYDLSDEIEWIRWATPGQPNYGDSEAPDLQGRIDDFEETADDAFLAFELLVNELPGWLETLVSPIVSVVSFAVRFAVDIAVPALRAVAWVVQPILNIVWPLLSFLVGYIWYATYSVTTWFVIHFLETAQLVLTGIASIGGQVWDSFGSAIVYSQDITDAQAHFVETSFALNNIGGNLGELASSLSFTNETGAYCATVPGGQVCPMSIMGMDGESVPSGFELLVALWVGFWTVFLGVQAIGMVARATD